MLSALTDISSAQPNSVFEYSGHILSSKTTLFCWKISTCFASEIPSELKKKKEQKSNYLINKVKLSKVEIFGLDYIIHSPWNSKWKSWDEWSLSINKEVVVQWHFPQ